MNEIEYGDEIWLKQGNRRTKRCFIGVMLHLDKSRCKPHSKSGGLGIEIVCSSE